MISRRITGRIVASLLLVTMFLVSSSSISAKPRTVPASGTWTDCVVVKSVSTVGDKRIVTVTITQTFAGTLSGNYVGTEKDVISADGSITIEGSGTFRGTIGKRTGKATFRYKGTATATGQAQADWRLTDGRGGLDDIRGKGTFTGAPIAPASGCTRSFTGQYEGQIRFH